MWGSAKELFGASFRRWYKGGGAESALAALLFVASDIPIVWILLLCLSVFLCFFAGSDTVSMKLPRSFTGKRSEFGN